MSRASCAATLGHLAEYRGIVDTLTKLLDDEAAADVPAVLERLAAVDTRLQQSASKLLNERAQLERTAALSERAAERRRLDQVRGGKGGRLGARERAVAVGVAQPEGDVRERVEQLVH